MKAAMITGAGKPPVYGEFREPSAGGGLEAIRVSAAALSQFSKSRSSGAHYSAEGTFPAVAGAEGVGRTAGGRRVYFVLPEAPFGALAETSLVRAKQCIAIPDELDDVTAAAIANPGMSAWAALLERAHLKVGETVLINGATGTAGRLATRLAKFLGARKVIGTGRNAKELEDLLSAGADAVIPFALGSGNSAGAAQYEDALVAAFAGGIDVVIDYLWGESAKTAIVAIAKSVENGRAVRFVHVGGASREETISLPGAALRSSAIQLMGSGVKSVPFPKLLEAVGQVFQAAIPAQLRVEMKIMPLMEIAQAWELPGKPRVVITMK